MYGCVPTHAAYQVQRSVGSKVTAETDGHARPTTDRFTLPTTAVDN